MSLSPRQLFLVGLLIGSASYGGGLVATVAQPPIAVAVFVVFCGAVAIACVRGRVRRHEESRSQRSWAIGATAAAAVPEQFSLAQEVSSREGVSDLRLARLSYYIGILLIGQLILRPTSTLTLSDWFFFLAICGAMMALVQRHSPLEIPLPSSLLAGIAIFAIGGLLSSFAAELPSQSLAVIARLCYVTIIWFWLGTVVLQRPEHIRNAIVLWVTSAALDGLGGIVQYFKGDVIPGGQVNWGRVSGLTQNVSDLGGVTSAALVPALFLLLFWRSKSFHGFTLLRASGVMCVATGLVLSGSVGSLVAAGVGATFWFGAQQTPVRRLILLTSVAIAFAAFLNTHNATYSQSAFDRISRFGSGSPSDPNKTLDSRIQGYRIALARIRNDPFVGVGLDSESNRAGTLPVHDIVLGTWFATGFLGLAGIFIIWLGVARATLSTVLDAQDADERALALALAASSVAFVVFLLSEPGLFSRYGWVSAALTFALRAIQIRRRREAAVVRLPLVAVASR